MSSLWRVYKAKRTLGSHFSKACKPDVAIGFGAYVEVPLLGWCKDAGIPYLLHEQNSVPGLANKMMSSHAPAFASRCRQHVPCLSVRAILTMCS